MSRFNCKSLRSINFTNIDTEIFIKILIRNRNVHFINFSLHSQTQAKLDAITKYGDSLDDLFVCTEGCDIRPLLVTRGHQLKSLSLLSSLNKLDQTHLKHLSSLERFRFRGNYGRTQVDLDTLTRAIFQSSSVLKSISLECVRSLQEGHVLYDERYLSRLSALTLVVYEPIRFAEMFSKTLPNLTKLRLSLKAIDMSPIANSCPNLKKLLFNRRCVMMGLDLVMEKCNNLEDISMGCGHNAMWDEVLVDLVWRGVVLPKLLNLRARQISEGMKRMKDVVPNLKTLNVEFSSEMRMRELDRSDFKELESLNLCEFMGVNELNWLEDEMIMPKLKKLSVRFRDGFKLSDIDEALILKKMRSWKKECLIEFH